MTSGLSEGKAEDAQGELYPQDVMVEARRGLGVFGADEIL